MPRLYSELGLVVVALIEGSLYPASDRATTILMGLLATVPLVMMRRRLKLAAVLITFSTVFVIGTKTPLTGAGIVAQAWVFLLLAERYRGVVSISLGTGIVLVALSDGDPGPTGVLLIAACVGALAVGHSRQVATVAREEQAVLEERARIARELHDVIAHHVSAIAIQADTGRLTAPGGAEQFEAIGDTAREAMTEMRRVLGVLRSDAGSELTPQPGLEQLPRLLEDVGLTTEGTPVPLSPGTELTAYRVVQEALTNARRHAPGASVEVTLAYSPETLTVRVRDDGPGGAAPEGHGLRGMRERVTMVGGSLRVESADGFLIEAVLPA